MTNKQKRDWITVFLFFSWQAIFSQSLSEPSLHLKPEDSVEITANNSVNYNPTFYFDGKANLYPEFSFDGNTSIITLFTVFLTEDLQREQIIWYLNDEPEGEELLTTNRVINLNDGSMIGYQLRNSHHAHFNHYMRKGKSKNNNFRARFVLGRYMGEMANLPVKPFIGKIGETRIYNKLLHSDERQIISTYYALKYGLDLIGKVGKEYRNSENDLIWGLQNHNPYSFRIAGIGRDDKTGFYQRQAASSYAPDLFRVAAGDFTASNAENTSILEDLTYLIWGDNNGELSFGPDNGLGRITPRKWLFHPAGQISPPISIEINQRRWLNPTTGVGKIWVVIDQSGTGKFSSTDTEVYPADQVRCDGTVLFEGLPFDADSDATLTFSMGPEMMPLYWTDSLLCSPGEKGTLTVGVAGGKPPFRYTLLTQEGQEVTSREVAGYDRLEIADLDNDEYILEIIDASGLREQKIVFSCPQEQPEQIAQESIISNYYLYPNPTEDGDFQLILRLREPVPVRISVINAKGQVLYTQSSRGDTYLEYNGTLPVSGNYFISIQAKNQQISLPIIRS